MAEATATAEIAGDVEFPGVLTEVGWSMSRRVVGGEISGRRVSEW